MILFFAKEYSPILRMHRSSRSTLILPVLIFVMGICNLSSCKAPKHVMTDAVGIDSQSWAELFEEEGLNGTFVLYDPASGRWRFHNQERANISFTPASTFKIFNSLVALELRAVANDTVVIPWDGQVRNYDKWNQDQSMRTAFKYSCVWYYQEIARRIGKEEMQEWLYKSSYGNATIGADVDQFWLDESLKISAVEQIQFLYLLEGFKLPFSREVQENVHELMLLEEGEGWYLYGKTGWGMRQNDLDIGWFVGFIHSGNETRIFAINIDLVKQADANQRIAMTRKLLKLEGLMFGAE